MAKVVVDGVEVDVPDGYTVLQACEEAGAEIPRFCYHERLSVAGNCRMCLVEAVGAPKPIASCAFGVRDLRPGPNGEPPQISTKSSMVKEAREGVMEFLLINHPLDCPICDQGGECDLQDQAMAYGIDHNRFNENKRAVENKYIGPLVKTVMTRCIHCTRCVRFVSEVAGCGDLGAIGRGEDMEITTYLESALASEMQGNVVDLCPVGALTSRPYEFKARPWELTKTYSVDVMDALGSNIRVDARGREVLRILPVENDAVNEEWISDKTRHVWDGLRTQRLDRPYVRKNERLNAVEWDEALDLAAHHLKDADPKRVALLIGDLASAEDIFAAKALFDGLGVPHIDCRQDGAALDRDLDQTLGIQAGLFHSGVAGIDQADAILMIGTQPRFEATVLNARLRQRWLDGVEIGYFGPVVDHRFEVHHLGQSPEEFETFARARSGFAEIMRQAQRPMIIVGGHVLTRRDSVGVLSMIAAYAQKTGVFGADQAWNGFNILPSQASRVAGLELGAIPSKGGKTFHDVLKGIEKGLFDTVYLLGVDEVDVPQGAFVIYQGSHGDRGAARADVILPGAAYVEKYGLYVNLEGRVQSANRASFPPGEAREDWAILRALAARLGVDLGFNSLAQLRAKLIEIFPRYGASGSLPEWNVQGLVALAQAGGNVTGRAFELPIRDYYATNPIARASRIMADCAKAQADLISQHVDKGAA